MRAAFDNYSKNLTQRDESSELNVMSAKNKDDEVPVAFCYSLYYMYYDQFTYINGIMY